MAPISTDEFLAFAKIVPGDEQLELIPNMIAAAREKWERDTDTIGQGLDDTNAGPRQAVLTLAAHFYTQRDLATVGTIVQTTPLGYDEMVRVFRVESLA